MQIKPVFASDGVADAVTDLRVQHHLGIADRARGEINQARIIAARLRASELWGCLADNLVIVRPALSPGCLGAGINQDGVLDAGTLCTYLVKLGRSLAVGNECCGLGHLCAELDIMWRQQRRARYG